MLIYASFRRGGFSRQATKWLRAKPESSALIKKGFRFFKNDKIE